MKSRLTYLLATIIILSFVLCACSEDIPNRLIISGITTDSTKNASDKTTLQNNWIYDQMKNDYLWADNMPQLSSLRLEDMPQTFFSKLLYKNDRFSWIEINSSYNNESGSLHDNFGMEIQPYIDNEGDTINRIMWISSHSEAFKRGLRRGNWIKITNRTESTLTLLVVKLGDAYFVPTANSLTLMLAGNKTESVIIDSIYTINRQNIGYFMYNQFNDTGSATNNPYRDELRTMISKFKAAHISELIIDLRYNHGGYVSICQFLCGLLLPDRHLGTISGFHSFNSRRAKIQIERTQKEEQELFFPEKNIIGNDNLELPRIHFIVSGKTASASESLINSLSPLIETVLIGTNTTGKGVGSWTIQSSVYEWQLQPITFRYYNKNHETIPDTGLVPDIYVDETYIPKIYDIGDTRELLLSAALGNILGNNVTKPSHDVYYSPSLKIRAIETLSSERRNISGHLME